MASPLAAASHLTAAGSINKVCICRQTLTVGPNPVFSFSMWILGDISSSLPSENPLLVSHLGSEQAVGGCVFMEA